MSGGKDMITTGQPCVSIMSHDDDDDDDDDEYHDDEKTSTDHPKKTH